MALDVAVVGSGAIGRSCAWLLAKSGLTVGLFDPHPASGASFVAAGMLAPVTEAAYGEEATISIGLRSAAAWPEFSAELEADAGLGTGYRRSGTLLVGADVSDRAQLEELHRFHVSLGLPSRLLAPSEARAIEPLLAPSVRGGIFAEGDAQVDNRRLLSALFAAGAHHGVIEHRSVVREITTTNGRVTGVVTDTGRHEASCVVLSAGFRSIDMGGLPVGTPPPTRPIKGQILRLHTPDHAATLSATVRAVVAGFSVYIVPREGGQVVIGATQEERGPDETVTAGGVYTLLRDALRVLPALDEYEITEVRAGLRPGSPDNAAIVGESGVPGLLFATGHHRNGLLLAPVTAEVIFALVTTGVAPAFAAVLGPHRFSRDL